MIKISPPSVALAIVSALLTGCVTPQTQAPQIDPELVAAEQLQQKAMVFERNERFYTRVASVAYPILKANTDLCEDDVRREFGFEVSDRSAHPRDFREGFEERYGKGQRPIVTIVHRDMPAFKAGLVRGHRILALNGEDTRDGRGSARAFVEDLRDYEEDLEPITLTIEKDGVTRTVELTGDLVCDYGLAVQDENVLNAYADGSNIIFTTAMIRFMEDDNELATVVGHEIAHNLMDHLSARSTNTMIGGLLGLLVDSAAASAGTNTNSQFTELGMQMGQRAFNVSQESEADYVGLYLMERAGYDSSNVANLWRRMAAENPQGIQGSGTLFGDSHPITPQRFLALQAINQEITAKRAAGEPLLPNYKSD